MKNGFLDLAAALFVIGGVISLIVSILALPIFSVYPLILVPFGLVFAVLFIVGLICSLVAVHCYSLTTKRFLPQAGDERSDFRRNPANPESGPDRNDT